MNSIPNIITGAGNGSLSYEVVSSMDIYQEDVAKALGVKVPSERPFMWLKKLEQKGRMVGEKKLAKRKVFHHFEDGEWMPAAVKIASKTTPASGQVKIVLTSDSHTRNGTASYPKIHQLCQFQDRSVGFVIAVDHTTDNAHAITIKQQNTSQDVQAAAVVGETVIFYANQQEEGSKKTDGYVPEFEKITHKIHTLRESQEATDHEMQEALWFEVKDESGNKSMKLYYKALDDMAKRFNLQEDVNLLITPEAENITGVQKGGAIQSATGLIPKIEAGGFNIEYSGTPGQETFETIERIADKTYGDDEYLVGQGLPANQGLRQWVQNFAGDDKGITFAGEDKQSIGIDFTSVKLGDRKFHFDTWQILTKPELLGEIDAYGDMMIFIPMGSGKVYNDEYGEQTENRPYMHIRYQKAPTPNNIADDVYTWTHGALSPNQTSDELIHGWERVSYKTLVTHCINKFGLATKA